MWAFVHPGLAFASLALAAIPIAIHLLSRRRYHRVTWAAMRFLQRAHRRTRRRTRLEQWLLLALRTAIMLLIALALARPLTQRWSAFSAVRGQRIDRVLLIDDSGSMNARRGDGRIDFAAARDAAMQLLPTFGPNDGVAIVTTASPAQTDLISVPQDEGTLRRTLTGLSCSFAQPNFAAALDQARAFFDRNPLPADRRVVYLISNLAQTPWLATSRGATQSQQSPAIDALRRLRDSAQVLLVTVEPRPQPNAAVTAFACDDRLVGCEWPVNFTATIANFLDRRLDKARVEFRVDGRVVRTADLKPLDPGDTRTIPQAVQFERPGPRIVTARLVHEPDALPADDARSLAVEAARAQKILVVESAARASGPAQSHYLARALAPLPDPSANHFAVTTITDFDLRNQPFRDVAAIVLADVRRLSDEQWTRLAHFVRDGGGLLIIAAEQTTADAFNRGPRDLIPAALRRIHGADAADSAPPASLKLDDWTHPVLRDFAGQSIGGLLTASFVRYWEAEPEPDAREILNYTDGAPALLERDVGRGRVMLWTTSANMAWNNFAAKPDYVTLFLNILGYLVPPADAGRNTLIGERVDVPVAGAAIGQTATLRGPDGDDQTLPISESDGRTVVRIDTSARSPGQWLPGPYELTIAANTRKLAFNLAPSISDLHPWSAVELRAATGGSIALYDGVEPLLARQDAVAGGDFAEVLLMLLFAVLLIETFVALSFGNRS